MTTRTCFRCKESHPATTENFYRDKARPLGLSYECKPCLSARKRGRDRRAERWSNMTPDQKVKRQASQKRYNRTVKGRACQLQKAYQRIDACDLSTDEIASIIEKPCHYCKTSEENRGLDRINNGLAHVRGNVLPACRDCNVARANRFTVEEMMVIGAAISRVKDAR